MGPTFSPYGYQPFYNPMATPQQRLAEMEQQHSQFVQNQNGMNSQMPNMAMNQNFMKCRAVTSVDEAKAAMIDLDGSIHVFTDIANRKIYTKQINLDGTATLNTYVLDDPLKVTESEATGKVEEIDLSAYVQQKDLEDVCQLFNTQIDALEDRMKGYDRAIQMMQEKAAPAAKGGKK